MTERVKRWTAGPWHIDEQEQGLFNNRCLYVCEIPVADGDAHLIASAPDIVEALDDCLNALIGSAIPASGDEDREAIIEAQNKARAALRKAYGEGNDK